jgi:hypothetical protein
MPPYFTPLYPPCGQKVAQIEQEVAQPEQDLAQIEQEVAQSI